MTKKDDFNEAVFKLNKLTSENIIKWNIGEQNDNLKKGIDDIIESIFFTEHNNKSIRIYVRRYKTKVINQSLGVISFHPEYEIILQKTIILEITNHENGFGIFSFPASQNALEDLLSTIKYQASGAKKFISDLLAE